MASEIVPSSLLAFILLASATTTISASLSYNYYEKVCPSALPTIKRIVEDAVEKERRVGASILRLHFHDCFVHGCDASILLDESVPNSERNAGPNFQSARGFEVIDRIKEEVDKACGYSVVSCADILAVAARDSVVALGGPWWAVALGRRDSTSAYKDIANRVIPAPNMDLPQLINSFSNQGLDVKDLVALSGGHTLGFAQCRVFRNRIYNDSNINPYFASKLKESCPPIAGNGDSNLAGLDPTPARFDSGYFSNLLTQKGLLHSDQALFGGVSTDQLVKKYERYPILFWADFAVSMVKLGNLNPLVGDEGQIRSICSKLN